MKILITGIGGFIGSNLSCFFHQRGHHVIGHERGQDLVSQLNSFSPDIILHCAAEIYNVEQMFDSNIVMTWQCLDYVRKNSNTCRMIYFGSSSEYGWRDCVTAESTVILPHTAYAGTKAAGTYMCQGWATEFNLDIVTMRLYSIYGPGEKTHRLFPNLWRAFRLNSPMTLVEGVHDFVYIDDVINAVDLVVNHHARTPGEIINVASGKEYLNSQVLKIFEDVTGHQAPVTFLADKFVTQPVWLGNNNHLCTKYGWKINYDLYQGVKCFLTQALYE